MNKALSHLPQQKQEQIELITGIILEKIPDVRMIVLFGSYARGDWVEDTHTEDNATHVYESDFDILVATKSKKQAENIDIHTRIEDAIEATNKVNTPYSIIYHSLGYIKDMLAEGHYFFNDITKEGIGLYRKKSKHGLKALKTLMPQKRKEIAQQHFKQWFKSARGFYRQHENAIKMREYKIAAFELHQATERFFSAVTLVFINYRFRTHELGKLEHKAVGYDPKFAEVFPRETAQQRKALNLLKKAYIDARYKPEYKITKKQLEYLAKCVRKLQRLTKKICTEKIESFV